MNEQDAKVISEGWDEVDKSVGSAGDWMKWTDGQSHAVNVFGKPKHVEKDFGDGKGPKARVSVQVFVPGEGVKTWDMSPATYRDLKEEREDAGDRKFAVAVFKVTRRGSGADTRYKFKIERSLTAEEIAARNSGGTPPPVPTASASKPAETDDIPF